MSQTNEIKGFNGPYSFLSNFYPCFVLYKGIQFMSVEHAYQAAKCANEGDMIKFLNITAAQAKKLGRKIAIRTDWDDIKLQVMTELVTIKFNRHIHLGYKLIVTGSKYIEETNWWGDRFWGVYKGVGENHLGKILMKVRDDLRNKLSINY